MRQLKAISVLIILVMMMMILTGCQESDESKYKKAQSLLSKGQYTEAAAAFDVLGSYEDSTKLAMYSKAAAAGEAADYKTAIQGFTALGEYKDCSLMITYYTARSHQDNVDYNEKLLAANTYETIALFRDSSDRAIACRQAVYNEAVKLAEQKKYDEAIEELNTLGQYNDSEKLKHYYDALNYETRGNYLGASSTFAALGDFRDAAEQVTAVLQRGYDAASALEEAGYQDGAHTIFMSLGDYNDSFERACKPYYEKGISLRDSQDWEGAITAFQQAGTYRDAVLQIQATRYLEGETKRTKQDWEGAVTAFQQAGTYSDAALQIQATRYLEGVTKRADGDWKGALIAFEQAGEYSDAAMQKAQLQESCYTQAAELYNAGDREKAYDIYRTIQDYKDVSSILMSIYSTGSFEVTVNGFDDEPVIVNVTAENKVITSLSVDASTQTRGLGQRCGEEGFTNQFIGLKAPLTLGEDIDAMSNATVTSQAVVDAVNMIFASID